MADVSSGGNVMRMLSSWTVNIGTTFFLEAFAMKYGKIMPHCMAKELPVGLTSEVSPILILQTPFLRTHLGIGNHGHLDFFV